jgi:hypothetical protein
VQTDSISIPGGFVAGKDRFDAWPNRLPPLYRPPTRFFSRRHRFFLEFPFALTDFSRPSLGVASD